MYLFELISVEPLTPHEKMRYDLIAGDGRSLLFADRWETGVVRHAMELDHVSVHRTDRPYTGICHDAADGGYWACDSGGTVYRLTDAFCEVDRFACPAGCRAPRGIAYDGDGDCLILTSADRVITVDKRSLLETEVRQYGGEFDYLACIRSGGCDYSAKRQRGTDMISITRDGESLVHVYPPAGHRVIGLAEGWASGQEAVCILTVRHGGYHCIRGVLVRCSQGEDCVGGDDGYQDCDTDCGHRDNCHGDCHEGGCHGHCTPDLDESCAAILESIALEQTAISHILNAEGEKIQKILAVSDDPCDLLAVNRSVLDTVTRLTHLEIALFNKLDLTRQLLGQTGR